MGGQRKDVHARLYSPDLSTHPSATPPLTTGSPVAACLVLLTLASMVVDLLGLMTLTGIQLNAVSVVNLVAALGIGVEFCAHLLHAFMEESGDREQRTAAALTHVGAAVLAGITLTKFVGGWWRV